MAGVFPPQGSAAGGLTGVTEDGGSPNLVTISAALNVGTATDATAAGDFAAGASGSGRMFYDESNNSLTFYRTGTGFEFGSIKYSGGQFVIDGEAADIALTGSTGDRLRLSTAAAYTTLPGFDLGTTGFPWENAYISGTIYLGAGQEARILTGTGTPEGAVTAPVGALFIRSDGGASTVLYAKESSTGNTGWVAYGAPGGAEVVESTNDGRLSLSSSDPLGEATGAGTLYFHRYSGKRLALYDGSSAWSYLTIAATPVSIALSGGTASRPHDVFAYDSSGTIALELVAWTDDTTRATALTTQDGVRVKSGDTTRRYLGSVYLDGSKQATFDSSARGLWNADNRVRWESSVVDTTNSWTYTTATWRQANGSSSNQVQLMLGRSEETVEAWTACMAASTGGNPLVTTGVGIDSSTSNSAQVTAAVRAIGSMLSAQSRYAGRPAAGLRDVRWLEISEATGTVTWYGDNGTTYAKSGMVVTSWH